MKFVFSPAPLQITPALIVSVDVSVSVLPDTNEMNCTVQYDIVGLSTPTQTVDVLLFPARV